MKSLITAVIIAMSVVSANAQVAPYPPINYVGSPELAWGVPYAIPLTIMAGGLLRMYYVGEIAKRCWTEGDNQAVLVGPFSSGSTRCYQGPGAIKYKAP